MSQFYLLSKANCPLCTQAEQLLTSIMETDDEPLLVIDIATRDELQEEYGWLVPVVIRTKGDAELRWPFDAHQLLEFIKQ